MKKKLLVEEKLKAEQARLAAIEQEQKELKEDKDSKEKYLIQVLTINDTPPVILEQIQRNFQEFKHGQDIVNKMHKLEKDVSYINRKLGCEDNIKEKLAYISTHEKLNEFRKEFEKEFSCFSLCFYLASVQLFQITDNKKCMLIAAASSAAQSAWGSIPIFGASLGQASDWVAKFSKIAINKQRYGQFNRVKRIFENISDINKIAHLLSIELTLAKEKEIDGHKVMEYKGLAKIKLLRDIGRSQAEKIWKDLAISDTTGLELPPTGQLGMLYSAIILEQILSQKNLIDYGKELIPQLVEIALGEKYSAKKLYTTPEHFSPVSIDVTQENEKLRKELEEAKTAKEDEQAIRNSAEEKLRKLNDELESVLVKQTNSENQIKKLLKQSKTLQDEISMLKRNLINPDFEVEGETDAMVKSKRSTFPAGVGVTSALGLYHLFAQFETRMKRVELSCVISETQGISIVTEESDEESQELRRQLIFG